MKDGVATLKAIQDVYFSSEVTIAWRRFSIIHPSVQIGKTA